MKMGIRLTSMVIGLALLVVSCSGGGNSEKITLRFTPEMGNTYPVNMEINSQSKVMGMNTTTDMLMGFTMEPSAEEDAQVCMLVKYTQISFDMQTPMGGMRYDSEDTTGPLGLMGEMVKPVFDQMLAGQLNITFDRLGNVTATSGMEEMLEGIEGMESIGDQVNAAGQMGIATAVFPDREVGIGDTWTTSVVNQSSVPMLMKATYTLIDIQKDVVEIELYGESALYESDEVDPSLAAAFSELTGDFSGTLTVDRQTGITLQAAVTQQMQMKVLQGGIPLTVDVINEIRLDGKP